MIIDTAKSGLSYGNKSIPTTPATQLTTLDKPAKIGVILVNTDSANPVYVGNNISVTSANGFRVGPGEALSIPITNANKIYAIATGAAVDVRWIAV